MRRSEPLEKLETLDVPRALAQHARSVSTTSSPRPAKRILVADDDAASRELLLGILRHAGFETQAASTGVEAIQAVSGFGPDLVLLDVMMPELDGMEACKRIKEQEPTLFLPVLLMTIRDDVESRLVGFSAGADDFITKPFSPQELVARVSVMLRLREAQAKILELQRRKDEFLNIVTHDMKAPLTIIGGFCRHLAQEAKDRLLQGDHDVLSRIVANVKFMESMIGYFLSRATLDRGELELYPARLRLDLFLRECVRRNSALADERQVELEASTQPGFPMLYADDNKLQQVVNNLISNALVVSPPGSKLRLEASFDAQKATISVSDQGPGVPPELAEKIFEPGERGHGEPRYEGQGLGLAIARQIVEAHRGKIWVEPRPGGGAVFRFTIPIQFYPAATSGR